MTEFTLLRHHKSVDKNDFPGLEGILLLGSKFFGYTIERSPDAVDSTGAADHPCIPAGRYQLTPSIMASHNHLCALVNDVPGRTAIFIHGANFASELLGCIAPALNYKDSGWIYQSVADAVYNLVDADPQDSWITIKDCYG